MSEHQYDEFRANDRLLKPGEQRAAAQLSSRVESSPGGGKAR